MAEYFPPVVHPDPFDTPLDRSLRRELLERKLDEELRRLEAPALPDDPPAVVETGSADLDAILPDVGVRRGTVLELVGRRNWGREAVGMSIARSFAESDGRPIAVIDHDERFFENAFEECGVTRSSVASVAPLFTSDAIRMIVLGLLSRRASVVYCVVESIRRDDFAAIREAAARSGALCILLRTSRTIDRLSLADAGLAVTRYRHFREPIARVKVFRGRESLVGRETVVRFDDQRRIIPAPEAASLPASFAERSVETFCKTASWEPFLLPAASAS